jgi:hypothetical protein
MPISEEQLAAFLGVDFGKPAIPQECGHEYEGWAPTPSCEMLKAVRSLFPIKGGDASLFLANQVFWCTAPHKWNPAYHPAFFVELEVRGWRSTAQQLIAAGAPALRDGCLHLGGETKVESIEAFRAEYEKILRHHQKRFVRRLKAVGRMTDEQARGLLPHDVWSEG